MMRSTRAGRSSTGRPSGRRRRGSVPPPGWLGARAGAGANAPALPRCPGALESAVGVLDRSVRHDGVAVLGIREDRASQVRARQVRAVEVGPGEVRVAEVGVPDVRIAQYRVREVRAGKVRADERGEWELGVREVRLAEVRVRQIAGAVVAAGVGTGRLYGAASGANARDDRELTGPRDPRAVVQAAVEIDLLGGDEAEPFGFPDNRLFPAVQ